MRPPLANREPRPQRPRPQLPKVLPTGQAGGARGGSAHPERGLDFQQDGDHVRGIRQRAIVLRAKPPFQHWHPRTQAGPRAHRGRTWDPSSAPQCGVSVGIGVTCAASVGVDDGIQPQLLLLPSTTPLPAFVHVGHVGFRRARPWLLWHSDARAGRARAAGAGAARALAAAAAVVLLAAGCGDASAAAPATRPAEDSWFGTLFGAGRDVEEKAEAGVERPSVVNASVLLQMIADRRANGSRVVASFFSSSCPFSAELEPVFEALPQVCAPRRCSRCSLGNFVQCIVLQY